MPIVTFAFMPGFKSAIVPFCPLTLISVNCVMMNVLVVLSSLTVIAFPVTLEIIGGRYSGAGVAFFFLLPAKAGVAAMKISEAEMRTKKI